MAEACYNLAESYFTLAETYYNLAESHFTLAEACFTLAEGYCNLAVRKYTFNPKHIVPHIQFRISSTKSEIPS